MNIYNMSSLCLISGNCFHVDCFRATQRMVIQGGKNQVSSILLLFDKFPKRFQIAIPPFSQ